MVAEESTFLSEDDKDFVKNQRWIWGIQDGERDWSRDVRRLIYLLDDAHGKLAEAKEIIKCDVALCDDDCDCSWHTEKAMKFLEDEQDE